MTLMSPCRSRTTRCRLAHPTALILVAARARSVVGDRLRRRGLAEATAVRRGVASVLDSVSESDVSAGGTAPTRPGAALQLDRRHRRRELGHCGRSPADRVSVGVCLGDLEQGLLSALTSGALLSAIQSAATLLGTSALDAVSDRSQRDFGRGGRVRRAPLVRAPRERRARRCDRHAVRCAVVHARERRRARLLGRRGGRPRPSLAERRAEQLSTRLVARERELLWTILRRRRLARVRRSRRRRRYRLSRRQRRRACRALSESPLHRRADGLADSAADGRRDAFADADAEHRRAPPTGPSYAPTPAPTQVPTVSHPPTPFPTQAPTPTPVPSRSPTASPTAPTPAPSLSHSPTATPGRRWSRRRSRRRGRRRNRRRRRCRHPSGSCRASPNGSTV